MSNTNITTTKLAKAATIVMSDLATPTYTSAPIVDLTVRLGLVKEVEAGTVQQRFLSAQETIQTVDAYGQWSTATSNLEQAFAVKLWDSLVYPIKLDIRHIGSSNQGLLEAMKEAVEYGMTGFMDQLSYNWFNNANWDNSAYNKPHVGIKVSCPQAATGTMCGVDRAVTTAIQNFYVNGSTYGGGATAVCDEFTAPTTGDGFLEWLDKARIQAQMRGGSQMVLFCDPMTAGYFSRYASLKMGGAAAVAGKPGWVPDSATQGGLTVGSIGYSTLVYNDILVVPTRGVDTSVAHGYLVPFRVNGQANVVWAYNKAPKGAIQGKVNPIYCTDWDRGDRSFTYDAAINSCSALYIADPSVTACLLHDGNFSQ